MWVVVVGASVLRCLCLLSRASVNWEGKIMNTYGSKYYDRAPKWAHELIEYWFIWLSSSLSSMSSVVLLLLTVPVLHIPTGVTWKNTATATANIWHWLLCDLMGRCSLSQFLFQTIQTHAQTHIKSLIMHERSRRKNVFEIDHHNHVVLNI